MRNLNALYMYAVLYTSTICFVDVHARTYLGTTDVLSTEEYRTSGEGQAKGGSSPAVQGIIGIAHASG